MMKTMLGGLLVIVLAGGMTQAGGARAGEAPAAGVAFNGRTSYAQAADPEAFDLDAFSVAAWAKFKRTDRSQALVNRAAPGGLFTLYLYENRIRMLVEYEPSRYTHANAAPPQPDTWTHFLGTYDGQTIRLFVNGRLVASQEAPGRIPVSRAPLMIGAIAPGVRVLDGEIDDVRVWRRALPAEEAAQVAQRGEVVDGLVAQWTRQSLDGETWRATGDNGPPARYLADPKIEIPADPSVPPWQRTYPSLSEIENRKLDGYRSIWYYNQPQNDEYVYKYSGGLGTYSCKHRPIAVYRPEVNKTFFCYGGTDETNSTLLHMVSYYDHATGTVPRPTLLLDKRTTDAHDNPVIAIDAEGYVFIFSSSHGTPRPSYISRSKRPYDIDEFERIVTTNFSYTQPFHIPGKGFVFPQTIYQGGRAIYFQTSPDGYQWTEPRLLSLFGQGHYQISEPHGAEKLGSAFNYHPQPTGLNWRTNLYYMQTADFGENWQNAAGEPLEIPLNHPENPALVQEYESKGRIVYMKDITFDAAGHPVILYLTSGGWQSGPANDPRIWQTARWTGSAWDIQGSIRSDNNYDFGSLYIEPDGTWRLIAPTESGPQPYNPGGEVAIWTSSDQGRRWTMQKQLTRDSQYNHTYVRRPVQAHPDFYAIWADGHARRPSDSRLYFTDRDGTHVWRLPVQFDGDTAKPEVAW
jgi:hypothetical protein